MNPLLFEELSPPDRLRVHDVASQFAATLRADPATAPPDIPPAFAGPVRRTLVCELIAEDFYARTTADADDSTLDAVAETLVGRWPADAAAVIDVLARETGGRADWRPTLQHAPDLPGFKVVGVIDDRPTAATSVYLAFQRGAGRDVAVKVLKPDRWDDADAVEHLRREATRQAALHGAGVPAVFALGFGTAPPFFAMEHVRGRRLRDVLPAARLVAPFGPDDVAAVRLVAAVAAAVAPAHAFADPQPVGLCHLDLSPNNVLIDAYGRVVVLDWGLGRDRTSPPAAGGTPGYFAPEKARTPAGPCDARTDVYSLGCFLTQVLLGVPPTATDRAQLAGHAAQLEAARGQLRAAVAGRRVPAELVALAFRCLETDPRRRPADAAAVVAAVDAYFESAEQRRQQAVARMAWYRRLGVAAALVAAVVAGWKFWRERDHARWEARHDRAARQVQDAQELFRGGKTDDARTALAPLAGAADLSEEERFEVRLWKLRAVTFLNDRAAAAEELAALDSHPLAERFRGRLDFERAVQLLGRSMEQAAAGPAGLAAPANQHDAEAVRLLHRVAADEGMSKADRATARGLLAATAPDALAAYEDALLSEPFHPYAGSFLLSTATLAGRWEVALRRADVWTAAAPRDPLPRFVQAYAYTVLRRYNEADNALELLAQSGGGRAFPPETVRGCTALVRSIRLIDGMLPRVAVADSLLDQWGLLFELLGKLKDVNADDVRLDRLVLFLTPLSPAQRRSVGHLLAAADAVRAKQPPPPGALDGAAAFTAPGTVSFLRFLELKRQRDQLTLAKDVYPKQAEMAEMLHQCEKSTAHLWNIELVIHLALGHYYLALANRTDDEFTVDKYRFRGMEYVRKAAAEPNIVESVRKTILGVSTLAKEKAFTAELERTLDGSK